MVFDIYADEIEFVLHNARGTSFEELKYTHLNFGSAVGFDPLTKYRSTEVVMSEISTSPKSKTNYGFHVVIKLVSLIFMKMFLSVFPPIYRDWWTVLNAEVWGKVVKLGL